MYEAHNELVEEKVCFKWTLNNSNAFKLLRALKSTTFELPDIRKTCFFVYNRNSKGGYYEAYLECCDEFNNCEVKPYFVTSNNEILLSACYAWSEKGFSNGKYYYNAFNEPSGESNFKEFRVEITYLKTINVEKTRPQKMISSSYDKFWKNQELCDVEFLINEKNIKAHVVVLAAASPYFFAMFSNKETTENLNRVVDLSKDNDVTLENFQGFLEFIYGCKSIDELSSIVHDLLVLADKYNVDQLHQSCQLHISNNITKENVTKILLLSDKYNADILKNKAISFARANIATIKGSDDFDALCKITDVMRLLL